MKRMVAYLPVLALAVLLPALAYAGQETHHYGPQGQYQGRATTNSANPSQQSVYDNHGNYVGRVMTSPDGQQRFYDNHGNYKGRATTWPTNTKKN